MAQAEERRRSTHPSSTRDGGSAAGADLRFFASCGRIFVGTPTSPACDKSIRQRCEGQRARSSGQGAAPSRPMRHDRRVTTEASRKTHQAGRTLSLVSIGAVTRHQMASLRVGLPHERCDNEQAARAGERVVPGDVPQVHLRRSAARADRCWRWALPLGMRLSVTGRAATRKTHQ